MKYSRTMLYVLITIGLQIYFLYAQMDIDNNGNPIKSVKEQEIKRVPTKDEKKSRQNFTDVDTAIIINGFPSPSNGVGDLAFDGKYLWIEAYRASVIYKVSPMDGSIIKTIPTNVIRAYGLTFDNQYLWLADTDNYEIQKIDTATGTVIQSFPTPADSTHSYPGGLAWDGTNLWHNDKASPQIDSGPDLTFQIDTTGQTLQTFSAVGAYPTGLAWDGQHLWTSDNAFKQIHQVDPTNFNILRTIAAPGGDYPNGLAWDGQYLWVSNNDADSIYQLDVGLTGIDENEFGDALPYDFVLFQNYPNPFNPSTKIKFSLPKAGKVEIDIYNVSGQFVGKLLNGTKKAGTYIVNWDASNMSSGMYFIRIKSGDFIKTRKCLLIK